MKANVWHSRSRPSLATSLAAWVGFLTLAAGCAPERTEDSPLGVQRAALEGTASFREGENGYTGAIDGYISGYLPGNTQRATVFGDNLLPVWHNIAGQDYQAESILRFDDLVLPAGAQVTSAMLTLTFSNWYTGFTMTGHYLNSPWDEAMVGWVIRDAGSNWSVPGAKGAGTDIHAGASFSSSTWVGNGEEVKAFALDPAIVQGWVDDPATNHGIILTNNASSDKYLRVYASEDTLTRRPLLTIDYSTSEPGCATSTASSVYNEGFTPETGTFTITAGATPVAGSTDVGFGVNQDPPVGESDDWHTAVTFRFNSATGQIDARDGSSYVSPSPPVPFSSGSSYLFRAVVDVPAHTYDAYVTPPGGSEVLLGSGLAFRSNYASASSLNNARGTVDSGSVQICDIEVTSGSGGGSCGTGTASNVYNQGFTAEAGTFIITADAIPAAGSTDVGFGVNQDPPVGESDDWHTAVTFRFNSVTGQIDARDGSSYVSPSPPVSFSYGSSYHFRAVVDVPAHTYDAYVTPPGGSEVLLGSGLAFRSNYGSAGFLDSARSTVDSGSVQICNIEVSAGGCTPESDTEFCSRVGKNCGPVSGTDNCGAPRTVSSCGTCTSPGTCGGGGTANVCGEGGSSTPYDSGVTVHLERTSPTSIPWVSFGLPVPPGRLGSAASVQVFPSGSSTPIAGIKVKPLLREHDAEGAAVGVRAVLVQIPASAVSGSAIDVDVSWTGGSAASDTVPFGQASTSSAETALTAQRTISQNGGTCSLVETSTATQTLFTGTEPVFMAHFPADYLSVTGILGSLMPRSEVVSSSDLSGVQYLSDSVTPFGLSAAYLDGYRLNPAPDSVVDPVANFEGWLYDRCATFLAFYAHTGDVRFLRAGYRHCSYYASRIDAAGIFTGKPTPDIKYSHLRGLYAYYALTGDEAAFTAGQNIADLWLSDETFVQPYREGHLRGWDKLWTERLLGTSLEGLYYGHRLLDQVQYLTAMKELIDTAYLHVSTPSQATLDQITTLGGAHPNFPPQNCFIHSAVQHAEADHADDHLPWCSGWMTELTIDALLEYQKQTGDDRVDEMFIRLARALRDVGSVYWVNNFGYYDDTFLNPTICYNPNAGENRRQLVPAYGAALDMAGGRFVEHDADEEHCADAAGLMAVAIRALERQGLYDQGGPVGPFSSEGASFLQMLHEFSFCAANRFEAWTRLNRVPANWTSSQLCPGAGNPAAFISANKIGYPSRQIGPQRKLSWWFNQSLVQYALLDEAGVSVTELQPGTIEPCP